MALRSLAALSAFVLLACSSDGGTSGPAEGSSFIPGHGVRALHTLFSPNDGSNKSWLTADVSVSAPGRLEWIHGLAASTGDPTLFRYTLDLASGQVLDDKGSTKGLPLRSLLLEGGIRFVPYTTSAYGLVPAPGGYAIDGDIQFGNVGSDLGRGFRAYANGDALSGSKGGYYGPYGENYLSDLNASYRASGARETKSFLFRHSSPIAKEQQAKMYRAGAVERAPNGDVIALLVSGESIVARTMSERTDGTEGTGGTELARIPFAGLVEAYHAPITPLLLRSRLSKDGSRIACMLIDLEYAGQPPQVTTFTYEIATKKLAVVVADVVPTGLTASFLDTTTFDLDGQVYFGANVDPVAGTGLRIVKQGPTEQTVLATGFLPDNAYVGLQYMSEIDGNVYLAFSGRVGISDRNKLADGPSQTLGVIE